MRVAGGEVAHRAVCDGDEKQMRALVAGVVVPVAVEQVGPDLRLDGVVGGGLVFCCIAAVSGPAVRRTDGRTVGIDGGGEDDGVLVWSPDGVVGFSGDVGERLCVAGDAGGRVKVREPDLLAVLPTGKEEHGVAVSSPLEAAVTGLRDRDFEGGVCFD